MIKILAFDTATEACSAAVMIGNRQAERFELAPRQHADLLLPMIHSLLTETDCQLSELDAIAFGQGPGSFMGVRIAAAVAQALAFAVERPVIPISTLQTLAQQAYMSYHYEQVVTAWDARMGEVYWAVYELNATGTMQPTVIDSLSLPNQLRLFLEAKAAKSQQYGLVGNAFQVYESEFLHLHDCMSYVDAKRYPTALAMTILAKQAFQQNKMVSALDAEPFYLRNEVAKIPKRQFQVRN